LSFFSTLFHSFPLIYLRILPKHPPRYELNNLNFIQFRGLLLSKHPPRDLFFTFTMPFSVVSYCETYLFASNFASRLSIDCD
jgi:hypothetical protein